MKKLLLLSLLFITTLSQANDSCILDNQIVTLKKFKTKLITAKSKVSYYAHKFHGRITANGKKYNMYAYTCAHKTYKFGTKLKVTNLKNKKYVVVVVNDRGPYCKGRELDLSLAAFKRIGSTKTGVLSCKIEKLT